MVFRVLEGTYQITGKYKKEVKSFIPLRCNNYSRGCKAKIKVLIEKLNDGKVVINERFVKSKDLRYMHEVSCNYYVTNENLRDRINAFSEEEYNKVCAIIDNDKARTFNNRIQTENTSLWNQNRELSAKVKQLEEKCKDMNGELILKDANLEYEKKLSQSFKKRILELEKEVNGFKTVFLANQTSQFNPQFNSTHSNHPNENHLSYNNNSINTQSFKGNNQNLSLLIFDNLNGTNKTRSNQFCNN